MYVDYIFLERKDRYSGDKCGAALGLDFYNPLYSISGTEASDFPEKEFELFGSREESQEQRYPLHFLHCPTTPRPTSLHQVREAWQSRGAFCVAESAKGAPSRWTERAYQIPKELLFVCDEHAWLKFSSAQLFLLLLLLRLTSLVNLFCRQLIYLQLINPRTAFVGCTVCTIPHSAGKNARPFSVGYHL